MNSYNIITYVHDLVWKRLQNCTKAWSENLKEDIVTDGRLSCKDFKTTNKAYSFTAQIYKYSQTYYYYYYYHCYFTLLGETFLAVT
jgi:hypothetical protein